VLVEGFYINRENEYGLVEKSASEEEKKTLSLSLALIL
jgi:hypothetical protein